MMYFKLAAAALPIILILTGCTEPRITNTAKTGVEELLVSRVVEKSVSQIPFGKLSGQTACMDYTYLAPQTGKEYVQSCFETAILCSGIKLVPAEEAAYTIRVYCGALATDNTKFNIGTPELPVPVPDTSINIAIPELSLVKCISRQAIGRFSVLIIDNKTKMPHIVFKDISAKSEFNNWVLFFFIPFHSTDTGEISSGEMKYHWL